MPSVTVPCERIEPFSFVQTFCKRGHYRVLLLLQERSRPLQSRVYEVVKDFVCVSVLLMQRNQFHNTLFCVYNMLVESFHVITKIYRGRRHFAKQIFLPPSAPLTANEI